MPSVVEKYAREVNRETLTWVETPSLGTGATRDWGAEGRV